MFAIITWLILAEYFSSVYAVPGQHIYTGGKYLSEHLKRYAKENNVSSATELYITQLLDHFDNEERRTWQMRYFEDLEFWQPNGPIYLYINGEATAKGVFQGLSLYDLVASTGGAMFMSEHRYYGKSIPLDPSQVENLKYLSSKQALADVASLIKTIKSKPEYQNSKVAVIGGSYAGNLAAWMRLKYSDLVDAAWSSSAPILAKVNFYEYLEKTGEDFLKYGSQQCYDKIQQIFSNSEEAYHVGDYMEIAQNGTPLAVKNKCHEILGVSTNNNSNFYNFKDYDTNDTDDNTSWQYQVCTEFSYLQTTDSDNQPFGKWYPLDGKIQQTCAQFGINKETLEQAVANTNAQYGGLTPQLSKVVFLYGTMDPWSKLGLTKSLSDDAPVVIIPDHSHCSDLRRQQSDDSQDLINARNFTQTMLKKWLEIST